ncbi:putative pigeon [Cricetulus griseus]|uniref:Putative pigeon n=1 Tax=Cricetulus griseus TaxID=10029 RepID=A0A061IQL7_CRIGR|nr:putative pigeon [Cricetulus griseus]
MTANQNQITVKLQTVKGYFNDLFGICQTGGMQAKSEDVLLSSQASDLSSKWEPVDVVRRQADASSLDFDSGAVDSEAAGMTQSPLWPGHSSYGSCIRFPVEEETAVLGQYAMSYIQGLQSLLGPLH